MKLEETKIRRDITILELIILRIKKYRDDVIYINSLIYGLESLLNQLEIVDEDWKTNFRTSWLDIEVAYALTLDDDLVELTEDRKKIVEESLDELEKMTLEKLEEFKKLVPEEEEFY